jgi:hypothetical protein
VPAADVGTTWSLVTEDRTAVLAALARGECDGLLPAASEFMDGFAAFLAETGILPAFDRFPEHRQRQSIGAAFFCNSLVHKAILTTGAGHFHRPYAIGDTTGLPTCAGGVCGSNGKHLLQLDGHSAHKGTMPCLMWVIPAQL